MPQYKWGEFSFFLPRNSAGSLRGDEIVLRCPVPAAGWAWYGRWLRGLCFPCAVIFASITFTFLTLSVALKRQFSNVDTWFDFWLNFCLLAFLFFHLTWGVPWLWGSELLLMCCASFILSFQRGKLQRTGTAPLPHPETPTGRSVSAPPRVFSGSELEWDTSREESVGVSQKHFPNVNGCWALKG